jgi:hypothetical protein
MNLSIGSFRPRAGFNDAQVGWCGMISLHLPASGLLTQGLCCPGHHSRGKR